MTTHLPSLQALDASDDRLLQEELRCLAVRQQAALVRALADQVELVAPWRASASVGAQLVEELARLGCRMLEAASALSQTTPAPESGTLPIVSDDISSLR